MRERKNALIRILELPAAPPSLNVYARFSRTDFIRVHGDWKKMVWALCNVSSNRIPKACRFVRISSAKIYFMQKRKRDETNYSATLWKLFLDGLVVAGVIPDDTSDFVEVPGKVGIEISDFPKTIIEMECYLS